MRLRSRTVWMAALAVALAFAAPARAGNAGTKEKSKGIETKQSRSIELFKSASWNGRELPAGEYKVVWQQDGQDLKVAVMSGHRVVAEGRGRMEERPAKARTDSIVSRADAAGTMTLAELQLAGKKEVLVFAGS